MHKSLMHVNITIYSNLHFQEIIEIINIWFYLRVVGNKHPPAVTQTPTYCVVMYKEWLQRFFPSSLQNIFTYSEREEMFTNKHHY